MSYITRTANSRGGFRHDPARFGIFIHGGGNYRPPWSGEEDARYHANRFTLSLPTISPTHKKAGLEAVRALNSQWPEQRTFRQAVEFAREIRRTHPELRHCPIYACTDFLLECRSGGRNAVQLIDMPPRRPDAAPLSAGRFVEFDGEVWMIAGKSYEYHHGLRDDVTIFTLTNDEGDHIRATLADLKGAPTWPARLQPRDSFACLA